MEDCYNPHCPGPRCHMTPFNILSLCRTADKLLLKAKDEMLQGDEEKAYIFYMRFVDAYKIISSSKEYKKDRAEITKLLPKSKVRSVN